MSIITRITANPEAPKGRERICAQCGTTYKSQRATSTYCSTACRKKGHRGTPPKVLNAAQWSPITKALHKVGYIGITGPASKRSDSPASYALTVQLEHAFSELSYHFNRKGWGVVSREEFRKALRMDGIQITDTLSPDAAEAKLWRDRNTRRLERQS